MTNVKRSGEIYSFISNNDEKAFHRQLHHRKIAFSFAFKKLSGTKNLPHLHHFIFIILELDET